MLTFITGYVEREDYPKAIWMPLYDKHPEIQSRYGQISASGWQNDNVTVVSQSDHIFNGIRIAVKKNPELLESITILFIDKTGQKNLILLDKDGRSESWCLGFFDQIDIDLMELLDWN